MKLEKYIDMDETETKFNLISVLKWTIYIATTQKNNAASYGLYSPITLKQNNCHFNLEKSIWFDKTL